MDAKLVNGNLVLTIPFDETGTPSASGKTQVHASTRGNVPIAINGEVFSAGVNVYKKAVGTPRQLAQKGKKARKDDD